MYIPHATCKKPHALRHKRKYMFVFVFMLLYPACIVCSFLCECVPQLYTQMTVILDDPDFPRLTLTVSQLSRANLSLPFSLSVSHKHTDPVVECMLRAETHRKMPMHITHAHARTKKEIKVYPPICHMHFFSFVSYHEAWKARRQLTAAKQGRTKRA